MVPPISPLRSDCAEASTARPRASSMRRVFLLSVVGAFLAGLHGTAAASGYALGVRESLMIAHSFKGEEFGPAQELHGATYTVDVEFRAPKLVKGSNWLMNLDDASKAVAEVVQRYHLKNLDGLIPDENTTTEFMCKRIHSDLCSCERLKAFRGELHVKLWESHKGWASYTAAKR